MKKFVTMLLAFIMCVMCFSWVSIGSSYADTVPRLPNYKEFMSPQIRETLVDLLSSTDRHNRTAGSAGELATATYIYNSLNSVTQLTPVNNNYFNNGVQNFEFINSNNATKTSNNIAFRLNSANANAKTIAICTHYDNRTITSTVYELGVEKVKTTAIEGVNSSAGAVAMLIAFAEYVSVYLTVDFNIEFVFLGAGEENFAGATNYMRSIIKNKDDYALIIDLNNIALGTNNYVYTQEFSCDYKTYLDNLLINKYGFKPFNYISSLQDEGDGMYSHAGTNEESSVFLESGINVANFFSGNHNGLSCIGGGEVQGHDRITNTISDNILDIEENFNVNIGDNLSCIAYTLINMFQEDDFVTKVSAKQNLKSTYMFFKEEKYLFFGLAIGVLIIFVAYYAIYDGLRERSKKSMKKHDLSNVVIKIDKK